MAGLRAITGTERSSGYARYIGRVGGLAFTLGVGAAVLTGGAVASADTSDSPTGSSESASASSSPSAQQQSGADSEPAASRSEAEPETEAESDAEAQADAEAESDAESATGGGDVASDETEPAAVEQAESLSAAQEELVAQAEDAEPIAPADGTETQRSARSMNAAPAASAAASPLADSIETSVEASPAALNPFETFFSNKTPTLDHDPAENNAVQGRIEGDLHPEDADSSRLTYTASTPAHGTVVIDADGAFVYTPGSSYTGQDRFDVTVSDASSGLHIHGFAGLLNLITFGLIGSSGHRTTESVFIGFDRAVVASGLNSPVDFRFLPDGRIIVAEKGGAIRVVENGAANAALITLTVNTLGERGVSGLAVDPDFATNGHLYVAYTTSALRNRLSRLTVVGNAAGSELVLLQSAESAALNHQGGALRFGPDGKLYWGVGDNGSGLNSQDLTNLHGKILRLNPDGSTPSDNPALGAGALPQIYAYGLRNPFRLTFTPNGGLLVADVGAASWEELNLVSAGGNYGWPGTEGVCNSCSSINPIYTYPRGSGAAITSVLVYDGATFGPGYLDKVFIADLVQGWIKVLTCTPEFASCGDPQDFDPQAGTTVVLAQGPDGNVYQLTYQPGALVRIAPAGSSAAELV